MKKKNGFTLAEALITIGIIGVIAALTLPSLTHDIQKQKIGPTLAKAVNTLENANMDLLRETETPNLKLACGDDGYIDCLANKSNIAGTPTYIGENYCIQTKDGIAFCSASAAISISDCPEKYYGEAYDLTIDIDPNREQGAAIDTFYFYVDFKGQVIPEGGRLYNSYTGKDTKEAPTWEGNCDKNNFKNTDLAKRSCAGSIADNGWKVIYKL